MFDASSSSSLTNGEPCGETSSSSSSSSSSSVAVAREALVVSCRSHDHEGPAHKRPANQHQTVVTFTSSSRWSSSCSWTSSSSSSSSVQTSSSVTAEVLEVRESLLSLPLNLLLV